MPKVPPLKDCTSYRAGHSVHWIQALHTANRPDVAALTRAGTLTKVDGQKVTILFDSDVEEFLNHDPERLLAIAGVLPHAVTVNDAYAIMRVGSYCFSIQPADRGPLAPCPTDELTHTSPEALADRLETHGGFCVRAHPAVWRRVAGRGAHYPEAQATIEPVTRCLSEIIPSPRGTFRHRPQGEPHPPAVHRAHRSSLQPAARAVQSAQAAVDPPCCCHTRLRPGGMRA